MLVLKNNGLKLLKIKSTALEPINDVTDIKQNVKGKIKTHAFVVAYLDNIVLVGKYDGSDFTFYDNNLFQDKHVQRIRIFNEHEELLIWRSNNGFKGRYRKDGEGDEIDVVDAEQVLFGTEAKDPQNGFTKITETRGTEIILPFPYSSLKLDAKKDRIFLKTRNYIDFNPVTHQATYADCRFIGFTNNGNNRK